MPVTVDFNFQPDSRKAQPRALISVSDGDTPQIQQPIRAVSMDTPEKAGYAGGPPTAQQSSTDAATASTTASSTRCRRICAHI